MNQTTTLQDRILTKLRQQRQVATVITTNGYHLKGRITGHDRFTVLVEIRNEQQLVYKHAISTIVPDVPLELEAQHEEA